MERLHTCEGSGVTKFASITKKDWLDEAVSGLLRVVKTTKPLEIRDIIQVHYAENVSYKVAQRCRIRLLTGGLGHQRYSFQLLPAYRDAIIEACPRAVVDIQTDDRTGMSLLLFYTFTNCL